MTDLLDTLEVNRKWIPPDCWPAVRFCGRAWDESGCPTTPAALMAFLDQALSQCARTGRHYPKILLKRLKQLQRGEWGPCRESCSNPKRVRLPNAAPRAYQEEREPEFEDGDY